MDEGIIVKILFISLWLLFILFQYFEIPYFGALFLLAVFLIVKFHKKEKNTYKEEFAKYKFDFNLRQYDQDSKLKKAFKYALYVLLYVLSIFIIIPYERREFPPFDYLYIAGFWALLFYLGSFYKLYDYYYFGKDFIKNPEKTLIKYFGLTLKELKKRKKMKYLFYTLKQVKP